jgi:hypothetical protein
MPVWGWVIIAVIGVLVLVALMRGMGRTGGGRRTIVQRRAPRRRRWI